MNSSGNSTKDFSGNSSGMPPRNPLGIFTVILLSTAPENFLRIYPGIPPEILWFGS